MSHAYPVEEVPATPEYVLSLLDAAFRSWAERKLVLYKPIQLTLDMTVAAWLKQFWFLSRLGLYMEGAECLNDLFGLDLPEGEWERFLLKGDQFTLGDLCRFAAEQMKTRQAIRPWRPIAGECQAAGAFLTLKSMLAESGADVSEFAPSTPLSDPRFGKKILRLFLPLIRLAPETFPGSLTLESPPPTRILSVFGLGIFFVGIALFLAGFVASNMGFGDRVVRTVVFSGSGIAFVGVIEAMILSVRVPAYLVIPGMRTYGDFACAIAGQIRRRSQSTL